MFLLNWLKSAARRSQKSRNHKRPRFALRLEHLEDRLAPAIAFLPAQNYAVNAAPFSVATADFNEDGHADIVAGHLDGASISILLGNGAGSFSFLADYPAAATRSIGVGDFNDDDHVDLAVVDSGFGGNTVAILLGDGIGGFAAPITVGVGDAPDGVVVGDLDNDGDLDLAVANISLSCALGRGDHSVFQGILNFRLPSLHYKWRSELNRSGSCRFNASRMRFCSLLGRAMRRSVSLSPLVVSSSISPI